MKEHSKLVSLLKGVYKLLAAALIVIPFVRITPDEKRYDFYNVFGKVFRNEHAWTIMGLIAIVLIIVSLFTITQQSFIPMILGAITGITAAVVLLVTSLQIKGEFSNPYPAVTVMLILSIVFIVIDLCYTCTRIAKKDYNS